MIEPTVASALGYSSQVIQNPPRPSGAIAEPCEYVDPGTDRIRTVAGVGPALVTATLIGEVTPIPVQEPYCVHDTNTVLRYRRIAGLSWNCASEFAAICV